MDTQECNRRASECAASAAVAPGEYLSVEFLKLAAQWRAMAARENFLGKLGDTECRPAGAINAAR
jgi:hypothetical protein